MTELREVDSITFNKIFTLSERNIVKTSKDVTLKYDDSEYNKNYFDNISNYKPYNIFCGPNLNIPNINELSKVNICSLDFLSNLKGNHIVLDYACGIGTLIYYSTKFFKTYGFDNWSQV